MRTGHTTVGQKAAPVSLANTDLKAGLTEAQLRQYRADGFLIQRGERGEEQGIVTRKE
jgi:hypothetical protein